MHACKHPSGDPIQLCNVQVLLSQYADINAKSPQSGDTPLHIACKMRNWETIEELLKYKANTNGISIISKCDVNLFSVNNKASKTCIQLLSQNDQPKMQEIINKYAKSAKPDRMCPCFSGKLLSECHAEDKPYPLHFLCICGTGIISLFLYLSV